MLEINNIKYYIPSGVENLEKEKDHLNALQLTYFQQNNNSETTKSFINRHQNLRPKTFWPGLDYTYSILDFNNNMED